VGNANWRLALSRGKKVLDAAHWVGAIKRGAEGSHMQLQGRYAVCFRHEFDLNAALLRHVDLRMIFRLRRRLTGPRRPGSARQREGFKMLIFCKNLVAWIS
jgi:hypothetical protein